MVKKKLGISLLLLIDIISILTVLQFAIFIRINILPSFMDFPEYPAHGIYFFWWLLPIWLFFFAYEGLYTRRFSYWDEIKMLWKVVFFSSLAMFTVLFLGKISEQVSRTVLVVMSIISIPLLPIVRTSAKKFLIFLGLLKSKVLILGAGKTGQMILNALQRDKNLGLNVVGFLDDDPEKIGKSVGGIKIHAGVEKAQKYIGRCGIEDVVIAMPGCKKDKLILLVNRLQHKAQNILLIPDLFGITVLGTNLQHFFQEQAIGLEVKNNLARPVNILIKKVFDLVVSCISLIILSVPMIIIAIVIKASSKGPAIYSQKRKGKNDRNFRCYKFRTMYNDADSRLDDMLKNDAQVKN